jgi:hypothetical protein
VVIKGTGKRRGSYGDTAYVSAFTSSLNFKSPESITMFPVTRFPFPFAIQYRDIWNTVPWRNAVQMRNVELLRADAERRLPNADARPEW